MPGRGDGAAAGEQDRYDGFAARWWDQDGPMRALHAINPLRAVWVVDRVREAGMGAGRGGLDGLRVLDVGCSGGLLSEALARAGAVVTGVDVSGEAIGVARRHAAESGLVVDYRAGTLQGAVAEGGFDVVCALEVVEHVESPTDFLAACVQRLRPGGLLFVSTISRTPESLVLVKIAAEYVARLLPVGTHRWSMFRDPGEIDGIVRALGLRRLRLTGMGYLPGVNRAWWRANTRVNWMAAWQSRQARPEVLRLDSA
ncbi:MAG: bifunctional 2-polyprenyl-6-hydroxyphenol methylase/3-demethylubiquinol 3-O-methyltransferase UbiG [Janthinobacterium lividum]